MVNSLYKQTALQGRFPCNMVALVGGTPQTLTLKQFLQHFLDFRCEVITRRAGCSPNRLFLQARPPQCIRNSTSHSATVNGE